MSDLKSTCLPENIRRCMAPEARKAIKAPTSGEAQAKLDGKREKELQENVARLLRQRNIWFARQRMDKRATGTTGQPDFLFAVKGRAIAFECKVPPGNVTDDQNRCHEEMMWNGWEVFVVMHESVAVTILNTLNTP